MKHARMIVSLRATFVLIMVVIVSAAMTEAYAQKIYSSECREGYRKWQRLAPVGTFSLSRNGRGCGWSHGYQSRSEASAASNKACATHGNRGCRVVASTGLATAPLSQGCRDAFDNWKMRGDVFRSFALSGNGRACGWHPGAVSKQEADTAALEQCRKHSQACRVIASHQPLGVIKERQKQLKKLGYYEGPIDGIWGPGSDRAFRRFIDAAAARTVSEKRLYKLLRRTAFLKSGTSTGTKDIIKIALDPALLDAGELEEKATENFKNGLYSRANSAYQRALEIREGILGHNHPETLKTMSLIAATHIELGKYEDAERVSRHALRGQMRILGEENQDTLLTLVRLANVMWYQGRYVQAETLYTSVLETQRKVLGEDHPDTILSAYNLAFAYRAQGQLSKATELLRSVYDGRVRVLGNDHRDTLRSKAQLAETYRLQGKYSEAASILEDTLLEQERVVGKDHPITLDTLWSLAETYRNIKSYSKAERLFRRLSKISNSVHGENHVDTLFSELGLANTLWNQGRISESKPLYEGFLRSSRDIFHEQHPYVSLAKNNLAFVYWNEGYYEKAKVLFEISLENRTNIGGMAYPSAFKSRRNLANLHFELGQYERTVSLLRHSISALPEFISAGSVTRDKSGNVSLPIDLEKYFRSVWLSKLSLTDQARISFEGQGWWTFGRLDLALNDLGARLAVEDESLASVVHDFQDTREQLSGLRDAYARSFEDRESGESLSGSLSEQIETAEKRFERLKARIERDFPELAELTLPRSLTAKEAQKLLRPGQGLIAYAATSDKLYAWLVTQDRVIWESMSATKARLKELVGGLGASVDLTRAASDEEVDKRCAVASTIAGMERRVFDACKAKELHDLVLGAFDLAGLDELVVVPDGPLETVPFSLLVSGFDEENAAKWLIEDYAISMLPSTSSLRALQQARARVKEDGQKPYLGIAPVTFGELGSSSPLRSDLADLPGTENEVRFLAGLLGSGNDGYVTGPLASETYVKKAPLDDYEILSFATHGLLSRQTRDLTEDRISEPALVLASSEGEDGLLTASEAATLRLDADWVLLSGCNTASGDVADAEGLSGLARAFFFAGARSLLVSHWSVDDNAAMDVMVETMKRSTGKKRLGKAQALRQAMLTVMNKPGYEHPFFWAPFSLVGIDASQDASHDRANLKSKWNGEIKLTTDDGKEFWVDVTKD